MTNPQIQEIEQEILNLAQEEAKAYMGVYGDGARVLIQNWTGVEQDLAGGPELYDRWGLTENMSRLEVVKKLLEGDAFSSWGITKQYLQRLVKDWEQAEQTQTKITELENEVNTHLQALNTAQKWHESQKREITEQKDQAIAQLKQTIGQLEQNLTNLHSQNKSLTERLEDQKQRILALEADKTELIKNLGEQKQKYHNHLNQEKSQLTKEIQLIKEVIYG